MDPLISPGDVLLRRYEVQSFLAEGGMQQVYRALDQAFDRHVALKVPHNDSAERRFDRSARLSAKIIHPNVAKTLDYFEENQRSYLVEELIDGIDLSRFLETMGPLDPHLGAHILHHLARAVAASHHVNVVHRDLKPGNVLISRDPAAETIKVTDFGIAKMAQEEISDAMEGALEGGEESITGSKTAVGALPYMAPEMIEDSKNANKPADIWAVGALAYRLFAGSPPYGIGLKVVAEILKAAKPPQPGIWQVKPRFEPVLVGALWEIIQTCLTRDPDKRPTADEIVDQCGVLAYHTGPRRTGVIARFPVGRGSFGFIAEEGGQDVFFHKQSFYSGGQPQVGARVAYARFPGEPQPRAYPVVPLSEEP